MVKARVTRKLLGIDPSSSPAQSPSRIPWRLICEGFPPPRNSPALSKKQRTDQATAQGIAAVQYDKDINLRWLCAAPVLEYCSI